MGLLCSASGMLTHPTATASSAGLCVEHHRHPRVLQAFHHLGSVVTHVATRKCGLKQPVVQHAATHSALATVKSSHYFVQVKLEPQKLSSPHRLKKPSPNPPCTTAMPTPVIAVDGEWYDLGDFYHKHPGGARSASSLDFSPPSLCGSPPCARTHKLFCGRRGRFESEFGFPPTHARGVVGVPRVIALVRVCVFVRARRWMAK
jgi:hypothetical protein